MQNYLTENKSKILEISAYAGSYLPDWRPKKDYEKLYSSRKNLGGGVDLDLIHEPDLLYYLFGEPEYSLIKKRKLSNLKVDSNDWAHIYLEYNDFSVSMMLNYFRKKAKREIEIVRETDILTINFIKGNISNSDKNRSVKHFLLKTNKGILRLSWYNSKIKTYPCIRCCIIFITMC